MSQQHHRGFTIIELMISIVLGMLIIAGVSQVYLSNRNTFLVQEGLARLQENGRFAHYTLNKDIRMAGYLGCANQKQINVSNLIKNPTYTLDMTNPIRGYDSPSSAFSPSLPANLSAVAVPGSDVLEIRMASSTGNLLSDDMHNASNPVPVYNRLNVQAGDPLIITDCRVGDMFMAGASANAAVITHASNNNIQNSFSTSYLKNAQILRYFYYAYYVKNTGRLNSNNQPIYALVRQNVNGTEDEIAEGVEKMRVLYGIDSNSDNAVDTYQTATQVEAANNWGNVLSIQLSLLMSTTEEVNNKSQTYLFNGATINPADKKLRREWNAFISLRNRGL